MKPTTTTSSNKGLAKLQALRDEIVLKAHLMTMEAKQEWKTIEAKVYDVEQRTMQEATEASQSLIAEMIKQLEKFRGALDCNGTHKPS